MMVFLWFDVDVDGLVWIGCKQCVVGVSYVIDWCYVSYFELVIVKIVVVLGKVLFQMLLIVIVDVSEDENCLFICVDGDMILGCYFVFDCVV